MSALTADERAALWDAARTHRWSAITDAVEAIVTNRESAAQSVADEGWPTCAHGVENGCESYRCGSNCGQKYDRMHPCRACLARENYRLRTAEADA